MIYEIVNWIKNYTISNNLDTLVVGISGGIDSSVVSTLCAMTKLKTIVVSMPIHQDKQQLKRARDHYKWLSDRFDNVLFIEKDLTDLFNNFKDLFNDNEKTDLSLANSRSRLRMVTLYQISASNNGLVVGTGNKIEDFGVGFFTKYGDGGVDISPIGDLTKTEVRDMANDLGIISDIINAKPTDGLWDDDRTDEDQLGATYEELEWAMNYLQSDLDHELSKREKDILSIYKSFNNSNSHKMVSIPIFKK